MNYDDVFSISPNPACMVQTTSVKGVLFKIRYCIRARQGLSMILGDVGMGKSSLLRVIYSEMSSRDDVVTTILHKTKFRTGLAMLKKICDDFGVPRKKSMLDQENAFDTFLKDRFANGKTVVLLIDEGQGINAECLEVIRSMLNYETNTHKLIQIVMAGQLDLAERLLQRKYRAIKSRIFAPCMVNPMTIDEARQLIEGRCEYWQIPIPFDAAVVERIYQRTDGVPRHVLNLAAMVAEIGRATGAYITPKVVDDVADDMTIKLQQEETADERETVAAQ